MKHTIVFRDVVWRDLADIPVNMRARLLTAVEKRLSLHPTQYGLRLRQSLSNLWKIRVGDYRIIYEIDRDQVTVWAILNRKDVYPEVTRRWLQ